MERLTMWYDGNQAVCENEECSSEYCPFADPICSQVQDIIDRLAAIEDILGDDYNLGKLREMVQADREGRCVVLPAGGYSNKDGERALKNAMFVVGLTNNGMNRYIADAIAEKLTRESAEADLKAQKG